MTDLDLEHLTSEIGDLKASNLVLAGEKLELEGKVSTLTGKNTTLEGEKLKLESDIADLNGKLETANELVKEYKTKETARLEAEKLALVEELALLREERGLPEKDYSGYSKEVIVDALETLKEIPVKAGEGSAGIDQKDLLNKEKEDVREMIFGYRKSA